MDELIAKQGPNFASNILAAVELPVLGEVHEEESRSVGEYELGMV
jgi:hypothetical protein